GFAKALASRPDAVVADRERPVLDGLGLLRALRAEPRTAKIPVIVITTVTAVEKVNQARQLGCAGFVLKPVESEYLLAKLSKLLA
ncbi:MAG: response regulator, partial [Myxococcaceae bacterium]